MGVTANSMMSLRPKGTHVTKMRGRVALSIKERLDLRRLDKRLSLQPPTQAGTRMPLSAVLNHYCRHSCFSVKLG
jgi:hypothetical protein